MEQRTENGDGEVKQNTEATQPKIKFPISIPFIIANDFCEKFTYHGMKAVLVLYLTRKLMYDNDTATIIYHSFNTFMYCMCIFGGIIADNYWGRFKTIMVLSIVYSFGGILMTTTAIEILNLPARGLTILALLIIAFGSGGIRPCVAVFGGDQFKLPEQLKQLSIYFSLYFFSINLGTLLATFVTPILRADVKCFGMDDCFSLAFGVPTLLMILGTIIFIVGKPLYNMHFLKGNMIVKVFLCFWTALIRKSQDWKTNPKDHWLEHAEEKHGKKLVLESKIFFNILRLFCILPVVWALIEQQGSRWVFQATRMDGDLGFMTIKPDQMPVINPLLIMVNIPIFEAFVYPLLSKLGLKRPLMKLVLGGVLLGVAFVISAMVEIALKPTYAVLPEKGQTQLRIYNGMNCNYTFENSQNSFSIEALDKFEDRRIWTDDNEFSERFTIKSESEACPNFNGKFMFALESQTAVSYLMREANGRLELERFIDDPNKSRIGPVFRVLANLISNDFIVIRSANSVVFNSSKNNLERNEVVATSYEFFVGDQLVSEERFRNGGVYTIIMSETSRGVFDMAVHIMTVPNSLNILWQIPQYVVLVWGEVIFSINGMQFAFTQAPESMKSVLLGFFNLTVAFGNVIVIFVASVKFFEPIGEFFFFAGLMFLDMIVFAYFAYTYKPTLLEELNDIEKEEDTQTLNSEEVK